jgi:hypothetical protein
MIHCGSVKRRGAFAKILFGSKHFVWACQTFRFNDVCLGRLLLLISALRTRSHFERLWSLTTRDMQQCKIDNRLISGFTGFVSASKKFRAYRIIYIRSTVNHREFMLLISRSIYSRTSLLEPSTDSDKYHTINRQLPGDG